MLFGPQHVGKAIVVLREAKGYSQVKLAAAIGIDNTRLSKYETGTQHVPEEVLEKIARFLGHEVIEILDTAYAIFRFNHFRVRALSDGLDIEALIARYDPRAPVQELRAAHDAYMEKRQEYERLALEIAGREKRDGFTVLRHVVETDAEKEARKRAGD